MRYSENYTQICEATETLAAERVGRALTEREKQAIWHAGTLTWLEMRVQVPMRKAQVAEQVETILEVAADELDGRLEELIAELARMIGTLLERELSVDERQQLSAIPTVVAVLIMGEDLAAAESHEREALFAQLLRGLA
ncbi:MAG: hypothetical protein K8J31_07570 [Anaerolineae bacterium]|nr:hypothetical protein [Anaerolineae bacterium]